MSEGIPGVDAGIVEIMPCAGRAAMGTGVRTGATTRAVGRTAVVGGDGFGVGSTGTSFTQAEHGPGPTFLIERKEWQKRSGSVIAAKKSQKSVSVWMSGIFTVPKHVSTANTEQNR